MAANVFAAALRNSTSEGNDRNVLLALADCAWRDGVTWILVGDDKHDEDETICRLARVSRATVWRSLQKLIAAGEVQTVRVRRGRSFVTVYRVLHGAVDVDYERIPFDLPYRFGEPDPGQRSNLQRSTIERVGGEHSTTTETPANVERCNLQRSTGAVQRFTAPGSTFQPEPVQRFTEAPFNVSPSHARDVNAGTVREPAAEPESEPTGQRPEDPAAATPVTDREITEAVMQLRNADAGSPAIVIPEAHGLPRAVFAEISEDVRHRGGVGLLVKLIRIAKAERTAELSALLAREMSASVPRHVAVPWSIDALKRNDRDRYVRVMAATKPPLPRELIVEVLRDDPEVDRRLALYDAVRAGVEPADRIGTPEHELGRWLHANAGHPDATAVIDSCEIVDPVARQDFHELADRLAGEQSTRRESEAA